MLSKEQKNASRDDELSFRHVVGRGAGAHHVDAMNWLQRCHELGALEPVDSAIIVHRLQRGDFSAIGILADVSLAAYDAGRIKRHEATVAKTQRKMLDYMQSTRIYGNPVALAHRSHPELAKTLVSLSAGTADVAFEAIDGAHHSLWVVSGDEANAVCDSLNNELYITDGHHRLSAAAALAGAEGRIDDSLPAAVFAEDELVLGAFARVVDDAELNRHTLLEKLQTRFDLREVGEQVPRPTMAHQLGVRVAEQSFVLTFSPEQLPTDLYDRLDVNLLQDLILSPICGIADPRTDSRLSFTADTSDVDHDVDGCTAWFLPYPTSVPDVMAVADLDRAMPPKSTYFMPKVPSGLMIRKIESVEERA